MKPRRGTAPPERKVETLQWVKERRRLSLPLDASSSRERERKTDIRERERERLSSRGLFFPSPSAFFLPPRENIYPPMITLDYFDRRTDVFTVKS